MNNETIYHFGKLSMRKIRIFEHISLDGVIEHDDGFAYGAWTAPYRTPTGLGMLLEAYGTALISCWAAIPTIFGLASGRTPRRAR